MFEATTVVVTGSENGKAINSNNKFNSQSTNNQSNVVNIVHTDYELIRVLPVMNIIFI